MTRARSAALLVSSCAWAVPLPVSAADTKADPLEAPPAVAPPAQPMLDRAVLNPFDLPPPERVMGMAELSLGWLVLPAASVCGDQGCTQGDSSPLIEVWNLVRVDRRFALGGGVTLGLFPTTVTPIDDSSGINRQHTRGYLTIEGIGRYYPFAHGSFEGWIGPGLGLVVMSDSFASADGLSGDSYVGSPGVTLRSEGLSVFGAGGVAWLLGKHFQLGASARVGAWQLPDVPARSPLGDVASINGTTVFFSAGLSAALRAEL